MASHSPAGRLASIREGWLGEALPAPRRDGRVVGVAFVGSRGRGEADDWSDVDLLVVVDDGALDPFVDPAQHRLWADAALVVDARQNAPAGSMSVGTAYLRSGLPLGVDWYVHPASRAAGPSDSRVVHDTAGVRRTDDTFAVFDTTGERQVGTPRTADELRQARLAMVPIAGNTSPAGRRSPAAVPMVELVGGVRLAAGSTPADRLRALRAVAGRLATDPSSPFAAAVGSYLAVVESTIACAAGPATRPQGWAPRGRAQSWDERRVSGCWMTMVTPASPAAGVECRVYRGW